MGMTRFTTTLALLLLLAATSVQAQVPNGDFETGDFANWTVTGSGWAIADPSFGGQGSTTKQGSYFATTVTNGENATGVLQSATVTVPVDKPVLDFLIAGHSMYPNQTPPNSYNYVVVKKAADNSEIARIYAPGADNLTERSIDLSAVKGQQVYIQAVDDGDLSSQGLSGFCWLAVDDFKFIAPAPVRLVFDDFETGSFDPSKWTVSGGWQVVTSGQGYGGAPPQGNYCAKSSYDASTGTSTDALTGTLTSAPFGINPHDTFLKFEMCGQDAVPTGPSADQVYVNLYLLSDLNTPVQHIDAPRQDAFMTMSVDVTPYQGKLIVMKVVDNRTDGFGWAGIDYIRIENDGVPVELSSFNLD